MDRSRWIGLMATLAIAAIALLPRVVWAPMFDDPGEVQLAAAVGGVGHPPGHGGIISIFRVLCVIIPAKPYLIVCAANAAFALGTIGVLTVVQIRTGVHPLLAGVCSLLFLTDDQFWHAATTTETYATCVLLLAGSVWAILSGLHGMRSWKLWLGFGLFAFLTINRAPTAVFALPLLVACCLHRFGRHYFGNRPFRSVAAMIAICLAALVITWGSVWARDVPDSPYNYLEQSATSLTGYPGDNTNVANKLARLWWLVSAKQYDYMFHPTPDTMSAQARWLAHELGWPSWITMVVGGVVIGVGGVLLFRRDRVTAALVFLMIPAAVLPILLIRVISHTALIPNLLFALAWLFGLGLTRVAAIDRTPILRGVIAAGICFAWWWRSDAGFLRSETELDARPFVEMLELPSYPHGATLLHIDVIPMVYAREVEGVRPDMTFLHAAGRLNRAFLETVEGRVFCTTRAIREIDGAETVGDGWVREIRLVDITDR